MIQAMLAGWPEQASRHYNEENVPHSPPKWKVLNSPFRLTTLKQDLKPSKDPRHIKHNAQHVSLTQRFKAMIITP